MLYPTRYPFFIPLNPFTTPILSPPPPIPVEQGMESIEGGFGPEAAPKKPQPAFTDDLSAVNGQTALSGDEFSVDDLLDFSKEGIEEGFFGTEEEEDHERDNKSSSVSVSLQEQEHKDSVIDELSVPADDVADLEWLSHFVEDSFSNYSLTYPAGKLPEKPTENRSEAPEIITVQTKPCFATPVQTKARSKRSRTGFRVCSLGSASESTTSTSSSSTTSSSPLNPWLISQTVDSLLRPPLPFAKKQRKRKLATGGGGGAQQPRRCSHCLVQKTPQWRAGPLGAKTLCNACGVRFKSGRLLPEYRPACSPTFSSDVHSNNHRKVLEMRRKKEVETETEPEPGPELVAPPVQSF